MQEVTANLKKYWGYTAFHPLQEAAIGAVMADRDSVVVLPTGGGKSLCYQAPATVRDGLALVVSPLISLMKDQVDALTANGVPAACINSSLSEAERRRVWDALTAGELKLLYVTPERLVQERFLGFLAGWNVSFAAIDEAHCVSEWGHDFRPEYRELKVLREALPHVALHAYTATATPRVRSDIANALGLRNPEVVIGSFDRPNLAYHVHKRDKLVPQVLALLEKHEGESGIIYCIRRKDVDALCGELNAHGHPALPYHAGLSDFDRSRNQDAFIREGADIIVATVAFGMGIDKPNVRFVIHAGMPKSIENYQQESGRAGRDGLPAACYLLHGGNDLRTWRFITRDLDKDAADIAERKLKEVAAYCSGMTCRHKALAGYFGEKLPRANCGACDVCLQTIEVHDESEGTARKVLEAVLELREFFGADYTADVLIGSRSEKIVERGHFRAKSHGALQRFRKQDVRHWIEQLIEQDFLVRTGDYNVLNLTDAGHALLKGRSTSQLRLAAPEKPAATQRELGKAKDGWAGVDRALFEKLRALRRELAQEKSVPPYVVFGDTSLRDMARKLPTNHAGFREITGVGDAKERDYAEPFLAVIQRHVEEHGAAPAETADAALPKPAPRRDTAAQARVMFENGASVEEVQRATGRSQSTVVKYLADYIADQGITDPHPWLDAPTHDRIREAAAHAGFARMRDLYMHLYEEIPYEALHISVACLRNENGGGRE